jgi:hypothetical protein
MSAAEFLQGPLGWQLAVVVLLWPAMWAGALLLGALIADVRRQLRGTT